MARRLSLLQFIIISLYKVRRVHAAAYRIFHPVFCQVRSCTVGGGGTHVGSEGGHVHFLGLCAHGGLVGKDSLHNEYVGEDDDCSWEEVVGDKDEDVVALSLLVRRNQISSFEKVHKITMCMSRTAEGEGHGGCVGLVRDLR